MQNNTNEANMLLKTKEGMCQLVRKRNQNEPNTARRISTSNRFERFFRDSPASSARLAKFRASEYDRL